MPKPGPEIKLNHLGLEIAVLRKGDSIDDLPPHYRKLITSEYILCFGDPRAYFHSKAGTCSFAPLRRWLDRTLAEDWKMEVFPGEEGYSSDICFLFGLAENLRPPAENLPNFLPPQLRDLYQVTNGTDEVGFPGGFKRLRWVRPIVESNTWVATCEEGIAASSCYPFMSLGNGDMLCFAPGDKRLILYAHEEGRLEWCKTSIEDFLTTYFDGKWDHEPPR